MKRCIANVLVIVLFTYSVMPAFSTEADISVQAVADAKKDAEANTKKYKWFLYGCAFSTTGYLIALASKPTVPVEKLMGKPPEYVQSNAMQWRIYRGDGRLFNAAIIDRHDADNPHT